MSIEHKDAVTRFLETVLTRKDMPNPAVKVGAWLIAVARLQGGFPVEVSNREIERGLVVNGKAVEGTGNHSSTIRDALEWMEAAGLIRMEEGRAIGFGKRARKIWVI